MSKYRLKLFLLTYSLLVDFRTSLPNPLVTISYFFFFSVIFKGQLLRSCTQLPHDTALLFLLATIRRNAADDFTFTFTSATFINKICGISLPQHCLPSHRLLFLLLFCFITQQTIFITYSVVRKTESGR